MSIAKLLAAPAAIAALALAVPAAAAPYHRTDGDSLRRDIGQLERQLDRLDDTRRISEREEKRLDRQIDGLERTWRDYARGGFTHGERRSLSAQIARVRNDLHLQANDRNGRVARRY